MFASSSHGRAVELFLMDGTHEGIVIADMPSWSGHVVRAPRTQLGDLLRYPKARQPGVYLLVGEDERGPLVYIGESENVAERIRTHDLGRHWWTSVVIGTSITTPILTRAHVRWLESRMIELARASALVRLENETTPPAPQLSLAHVAAMEDYLDMLRLVLPLFRVDVFARSLVAAPPLPVPDRTLNRFLLESGGPVAELVATARLDRGAFVVEKGSQARRWTSGRTARRKLQDDLLSRRILVPMGAGLAFDADHGFDSPVAAAEVILGRPGVGMTEWRHVGTGRSWKSWEARNLPK